MNRSDALLFGWDPTPAIVSVWADRESKALVWRRVDGQLVCQTERYRPWLYAAHLQDCPASIQPDPTAAFSYQKLEGAAGSLPYLISTSDGQTLEQALRQNAAKRLGREVQGLNSLDDYYQVGPVEQYLMQTGRTYFRELPFSALHRLQFDLETTALKPEEGRIFMIALRDSLGLEQLLEAPKPEDEADMIRQLVQIIQTRDPDVIENHNLMGFDLPFLEGRAKALGVSLELGRKPGPTGLIKLGEGGTRRSDSRYSVAGREMLDTLDATWRVDFVVRALPSHSLKDVARFFGVAQSDRVYLEGRRIYQTYQQDPATVGRYALQDVGEVDAIAQRLHTSSFALARMAPRRYERVAYAGTATGILEPLLVRAYLHAGQALPRPTQPPSNSPHAGGAVELFATGVAQRVVKADIASLYPSLIRTYHIGPECDRLGAFVTLVDQLTSLRLEHKRAAQQTEKGSLEQGEHESMQAAMKLVVNSAYGYLGAGRIAWFADPKAADEITRRGREILKQVCDELRTRGATLIEADTDGVYFAVTASWDEARERTLVAEVAATLPKGLKLEFDGRYAAMFSHEVKNYALLGYDGKLTLRGGALRSSRSEPFAEAWLAQALRHLLEGHIEQIRNSFLQVIDQLKCGEVPLSAIATKVRLTKSPEKYAASGRSESMYEAMRASGLTRWAVGEKVKVYKSKQSWRVFSEQGELEHPPYDPQHYIRNLRDSYAERLRKAFSHEDFEALFRLEIQPNLFDVPLESIKPVQI